MFNRFENKRVAVIGWGINGMDVTKFLLKQGSQITVYDAKKKEELDFTGFNLKDLRLLLGKNYLKQGLSGFDFIFRTPGVYRYLPEIVSAEKAGSVVTSATKLFFDLCSGKIIGVTGTKGKGTTSTLIYRILKKSGKDVYLAGNIGTPMLDLLPKLHRESWVVLELSSFQLIDLFKSPHISVVLNITSDHMDWHKDRREYVEAKTQIVRHQTGKDFSVLAYDYKDTRRFSNLTKSSVFYFSNSKEVPLGSFVDNEKIFLKTKKRVYSLGYAKKLLLRGKHNWENICAASLAAYLASTNISSIKKVIFSFKGLEHRLELVRQINGISFYNDSFSTNPQTTIAAIHSFEEPITLILGGSDKALNYDQMASEITKRGNVHNVILIGEISGIIESSFRKSKFKGRIIRLGKSTMSVIVKTCFEKTEKGGVVLLSPATASFDMFKDYKDRGNQFKNSVRAIAK